MDSFFFGYIIGLLAYCCIFGFITKMVADSKGIDHGFAWGFWLGLIGLLVVGFMQNRNTSSSYSESSYTPMYPEAPRAVEAERQRNSWLCVCGTTNTGTYCIRCRRSRSEVEARKKKCPNCGAMNKDDNDKCFACQYSFSIPTNPIQIPSQNPDSSSKAFVSIPAEKEPEAITLLKELAKLHEAGILSDEEFSRKKASILETI